MYLTATLLIIWLVATEHVRADDFAETTESQSSGAWLPARDVAILRREIRAYLEKESGRRSPSEARIPAGKPADFFECGKQYRQHLDDRKTLYHLIATHLRLAEALLARGNDEKVRRSGLGVASQTVSCAIVYLKDFKLAAAICDAWTMPNLDACHPISVEHLSRPNRLSQAIIAYSKAEQPEKMQRAAEMSLKLAPTRNSADATRMLIAKALERQKKLDEAIAMLEQITDQGMLPGAKDYIKTLKQRRAEPPK